MDLNYAKKQLGSSTDRLIADFSAIRAYFDFSAFSGGDYLSGIFVISDITLEASIVKSSFSVDEHIAYNNQVRILIAGLYSAYGSIIVQVDTPPAGGVVPFVLETAYVPLG